MTDRKLDAGEVVLPAAPPPQDGESPDGLVAKLRLYVKQFRALGGIPEMCELTWKLCNENEELKTRLAAAVPPPALDFFEYQCPKCEGTGLATTEPFPTVAGKCLDCKGTGKLVGLHSVPPPAPEPEKVKC